MRGERNFLAVTPASAGVAPAQTINTSEASTSGWFRLSFRGEMTYPINHNATEVQIKTAFENLRTVKYASPEPLSVTVTGTFDAGTSVVFTFGQQVELGGDTIEFHNEGIAGVASIQGTTIRSARGKSGFQSGQFDISLYAMVNNKVYQSTDGRLSVQTE